MVILGGGWRYPCTGDQGTLWILPATLNPQPQTLDSKLASFATGLPCPYGGAPPSDPTVVLGGGAAPYERLTIIMIVAHQETATLAPYIYLKWPGGHIRPSTGTAV